MKSKRTFFGTLIFILVFGIVQALPAYAALPGDQGNIVNPQYVTINNVSGEFRIEQGIAYFQVVIEPKPTSTVNYVDFNVELVERNSGAVFANWNERVGINDWGRFIFTGEEELFLTGAYYISVTGQCYNNLIPVESFSWTSTVKNY